MHKLYKTFSINITSFFIKNGIISKKNKDIYEYGFEVLISTFTYTIVFVLTSFLTKTLLSSLLFWLGFSIVRSIAGGYHANTHLRCHLLTMSNHVMFICFLYCIPNHLKSYISTIILLLSSIIILVFAPIAHPNKPFVKTERIRFRILSYAYAFIVIIIALLICLFYREILTDYLFGFSFGTLVAAISLVVAKIHFKKGNNYEEA